MKASVNNNQANQPAIQSPGCGNGGVGSQISAGSAALLYKMIDEIMALEDKIMHLNQLQKVNMIHAQNDAAQSQAQATESSGLTQAIMNGVSGGLTLVGVGIGLKAQSNALNSPDGVKANTDLAAAEEKLSVFKDPETALLKANKPVDVNAGNVPSADPAQVDERIAELQDFKDIQNNPKDVQALQKMKNGTEAQKAAFNERNLQLNKAMEGPRMELNTAVNTKSSLIQLGSTQKQMWETLAGGLSNIAQAAGNGKKAGFDATNSLAQTGGQMAGSASGDLGQAMNKALETRLAEVQIWKNVVDSSTRV